jgi:ferrous iron transport protein B
LERNLNLVLQVSEITNRVVVALNLMDEARRYGLQIDERRLARDLGVPVVPMVARQGEGVPELLQAIGEVANGETVGKPYQVKYQSPTLKKAVAQLTDQIETAFPDLPNARWVALRLLDGDEKIAEALRKGEIGDLSHGDIESRTAQLQVIGNQ